MKLKRIISTLSVCSLVMISVPQKSSCDTHYVNVNNPSPAAPYTNWTSAATSIQAAVDAASAADTVLVTNGTYYPAVQILIANGVTVKSVNGAEETIVNGSHTHRCFWLNDNGTNVIDGFTITNGYRGRDGGGVYCWYGGAVNNCTISENSANYGGGVYCRYGGMANNCVISANSATSYGGGVFYLFGGSVNNCTISGNSAGDKGGGVFCKDGGAMNNCTISGNSAGSYGGGVYCNCGGEVTNTIIYFNTTHWRGDNWYNLGLGMSYAYCCTTPDPGGIGNITSDPLFVNTNAADYRLLASSPCINAGTNLPWMAGATDLDGNPRIIGDRVDMGAYEYVGGFACGFYADSTAPLVDENVCFTGYVVGTNTVNVYYRWDFDNDGSFDVQGLASNAPIWSYDTEGAYSVLLTVSNEIGQVASALRNNYITVVPEPGLLFVICHWLLVISAVPYDTR